MYISTHNVYVLLDARTTQQYRVLCNDAAVNEGQVEQPLFVFTLMCFKQNLTSNSFAKFGRS